MKPHITPTLAVIYFGGRVNHPASVRSLSVSSRKMKFEKHKNGALTNTVFAGETQHK